MWSEESEPRAPARRGLDDARTHLEDVRGHGETVAMLYASESSIYGRFGFGWAETRSDLSLQRSHRALRAETTPAPTRPLDPPTRAICKRTSGMGH